MTTYIITINIRDGEYEYLSTERITFDGDPNDEKAVLEDWCMEEMTYDDWCRAYQPDGDYRMYRLYRIQEVEEQDVEVLRKYGI
jgi:hypothetical protein